MGADPQPGDAFGGLLLEEVIGRGGMGIVFRARDVALDTPRAVKVIAGEYSSDPVFAARFRREARIASSIESLNVVPVHAAGEAEGRLYLVMKLIDGTDLGSLLADGPLLPEHAVSLLRDIAAGLDAAHAAGLVHRDVKPANVLVERTADGECAYLTDFGISKLVELEARRAAPRLPVSPAAARSSVRPTTWPPSRWRTVPPISAPTSTHSPASRSRCSPGFHRSDATPTSRH